MEEVQESLGKNISAEVSKLDQELEGTLHKVQESLEKNITVMIQTEGACELIKLERKINESIEQKTQKFKNDATSKSTKPTYSYEFDIRERYSSSV